jgi:hypothetical protein
VEAEHVEGVLLHGCCADEVAEEFQHQHRQEVLRLRWDIAVWVTVIELEEVLVLLDDLLNRILFRRFLLFLKALTAVPSILNKIGGRGKHSRVGIFRVIISANLFDDTEIDDDVRVVMLCLIRLLGDCLARGCLGTVLILPALEIGDVSDVPESSHIEDDAELDEEGEGGVDGVDEVGQLVVVERVGWGVGDLAEE